ncbi:MAG: PEP-CTERM sorting domain-containing protein [Aquabacterium sp.]|uniref:PEP-CTERM sorting domain-containing protein n=1 Tax=Aquabacterium sp. TaxID=1872578 RepID=UPI002727098C|nr:PEP-CTERM sorting domain-containing protein [Aquabacterium sp.]MDO9005267.1 PEP-CTERM sorting domain-containing protein [Aquabacterium sp.]
MRYFSVKAIVLAMALGPSLGHAADSLEHVTATCSESLTILRGESLSFQCTGDLSVYGNGDHVRLLADRSVSLSATGHLSVDRLQIISPEILLNAGGSVDIGRNVVLFTAERDPNRPPSVRLVSGSVSIRPELTPIAGSLTLSSQGGAGTLNWSAVSVSNVPEPAVGLLAIAGIGTLLIRRHRA